MPKKKKRSTNKLRGKVIALNISPKGHIDGALLDTSEGRAQVNFPKHVINFTREVRVGRSVDLEVKPHEPAGGDHPIYTLQDTASAVIGTIVQLNYERHGKVNGYRLDEGTFVHTNSRRAKKYRLRIGERVKALGSRRLGADAAVLRATSIERLSGSSLQRGGADGGEAPPRALLEGEKIE